MMAFLCNESISGTDFCLALRSVVCSVTLEALSVRYFKTVVYHHGHPSDLSPILAFLYQVGAEVTQTSPPTGTPPWKFLASSRISTADNPPIYDEFTYISHLPISL